ncbi:MAG TPA: hypothetical protein VIA81_05615 [Acidimicrobiia bacterium]|jgi:hypothetical protein
MLGIALGAMAALAGLDLLGAYLAKEFSLRPRPLTMAAGVLTFAVLFVVYVRSLSVTELWVVTFGWVALLEIGVLVLDRIHYDTPVPAGKWLAAVVMIGAQVILMLPHGDAIQPR